MSDFGELTADEIESVLHDGLIARIGCQAGDRPYIVPVTYAYDGTYAYGYSVEGRKVQLMRAHPQICFQTDRIADDGSWCSVIAYGTFEALTDSAARRALDFFSGRLCAGAPDARAQSFVTRRNGFGLMYRIELGEKSGRYERRSEFARL